MNRKKGFYERFIKRPQDLILSLTALIILSPILLILSILVRIKLGSPIIFKQDRPGFNEKVFTLYKFKTMTDDKDENGKLLPDSDRLTSFGRILRSTSLDELPELFNILKGDMSFVGPRPQLVRDMLFMTYEQRQRHNVLPGLTGWAQVNGRNSISWEKKLILDLEYVENITFTIDCKIFILTFQKVILCINTNSNCIDLAEDFGDYLLREEKISFDEYTSILEKNI